MRAQGLVEVFFKKNSIPSQNKTQDFLPEKFTKKNSGSESHIRSELKLFFSRTKFFSEKRLNFLEIFRSSPRRLLDLLWEELNVFS